MLTGRKVVVHQFDDLIPVCLDGIDSLQASLSCVLHSRDVTQPGILPGQKHQGITGCPEFQITEKQLDAFIDDFVNRLPIYLQKSLGYALAAA